MIGPGGADAVNRDDSLRLRAVVAPGKDPAAQEELPDPGMLDLKIQHAASVAVDVNEPDIVSGDERLREAVEGLLGDEEPPGRDLVDDVRYPERVEEVDIGSGLLSERLRIAVQKVSGSAQEADRLLAVSR